MAGPSSQNPVDAWATKFGTYPEHVEASRNGTTVLKPSYPALDDVRATKYAEDVSLDPLTGQVDKPPPMQLADLLADERCQQNMLAGLRTWQAGRLNRILAGGNPGGHDGTIDQARKNLRHMKRDGLRLKQGRWSQLFKRSRWYNLQSNIGVPAGDLAKGLTDQDIWSVDNKVVWSVMEPCLELANRLLGTMSKLNLLLALLGGTWETWNPGEVTIWTNNEVQPSQKLFDMTMDAMAHRLIWTFIDENNTRRKLPVQKDGETFLNQWNSDPGSPGWFVSCGVHVRYLRGLLNTRSTVAEITLARFGFAKAVIHELMHGIIEILHRKGVMGIDPLQEYNFFFEDDWVAEIGYAMENQLFGGQVSMHPYGRADVDTGHYLMASVEDFPNAHAGVMLSGMAAGWGGESRKIHAIPTVWLSYLQTQEYWDDYVPRYGFTALRAAKVFAARCTNSRIRSAHTFRDEYGVSEIEDDLQNALEQVDERKRQYWSCRPWWRHAHREWSLTPQSDVKMVNLLLRLQAAFGARDERESDELARHLAREAEAHPSPMRRDFWLMIACMAFVCLPARETAADVAATVTQGPMQWRISNAAVAAGIQYHFEDAMPKMLRPECQLQPRHTDTSDFCGRRLGTRRTAVYRLQAIFHHWATNWPLPLENHHACTEFLALMGRAMRSQPLTDWISFESFSWPRLQFNMLQLQDDNIGVLTYSVYPGKLKDRDADLSSINTSSIATPTHVARDDKNRLPKDKGPTTGTGGGGGGGGGSTSGTPAPAVAMMARVAATDFPPYYTIGACGEHRATGDFWLLVPGERQGYEIWNVPAAIEASLYLWRTRRGYELDPSSLPDLLRSGARSVGRLMDQFMSMQDVRAMDGRDGRPAYIVVGDNVYDVTTYLNTLMPLERSCLGAFHPEDERFGLGPSREDCKKLWRPFSTLLEEVKRYQCGMIRPVILDRDDARELTLTEREVGLHCFPATRIYVIIQERVYDLTEYAEYHPGGASVVREVGGRDATEAFRVSHGTHGDRLLGEVAHLQVGRVVAEKPMDQLAEDEMALHGLIYTVAPLQTQNRAAYDALAAYRRGDASQHLGRERPDLVHALTDRGRFVTGKVLQPPRLITPEELARNARPPMVPDTDMYAQDDEDLLTILARTPASDAQMWVSVEVDVYNVTDIYLNAPASASGVATRATLERYAGGALMDTDLARSLSANYPSFRIGVLGR